MSGPGAGSQRPASRAPSDARTSIGSPGHSCPAFVRVRGPKITGSDRSRGRDQHPGRELDDRQDETDDRPQRESHAADQEPQCRPLNWSSAARTLAGKRTVRLSTHCRRRLVGRIVSVVQKRTRDDSIIRPRASGSIPARQVRSRGTPRRSRGARASPALGGDRALADDHEPGFGPLVEPFAGWRSCRRGAGPGRHRGEAPAADGRPARRDPVARDHPSRGDGARGRRRRARDFGRCRRFPGASRPAGAKP